MQHKRSWYVSRIEGQWLVRLPPLKWQCGGGQFTFHCLSCSNKDQPINQEQVILKARDEGEIFKCYKCGSSTYRIYDKKNIYIISNFLLIKKQFHKLKYHLLLKLEVIKKFQLYIFLI